MEKKLKHLQLPKVTKNFDKRKRKGGPYTPVKRDHVDFAKTQIKKLDKIRDSYQKTTFQSEAKYEQELVFKIKTTQGVNDKEFRTALRRAGCDTIISEKGTNAEWVVASKEPDLSKLKEKIEGRITREKTNFIDGIDEFLEFNLEDKLGEGLRKKPLGRIEVSKIVVGLNKKESDTESDKLKSAINLIRNLVSEYGFQTYDKLITENTCLLLLDANQNLVEQIGKIDLVSTIDRPLQFEIEESIGRKTIYFKKITPPKNDNHGVLVMDSGVIRHPLLTDAMNDDGFFGLKNRRNDDMQSHGTSVAGAALYGDMDKRIADNIFNQEIWIYSAKVFYENNEVVESENDQLFQKTIKKSLEEMCEKFPKCKVVNMSFGKERGLNFNKRHQMELAAFVDDLAVEYNDMIFVVSAGNIHKSFYRNNEYPKYLTSDLPKVKIGEPGVSSHAITVGALQDTKEEKDMPSNITMIGPGLSDQVKPELVDTGGGFDHSITVLNSTFREVLFRPGCGTSFSAPKIAHYLARLMNTHPNASRNLIKALLISSAKIPKNIPIAFPKNNCNISNKEYKKLLNVYGYGKPDLVTAEFSNSDRVVFIHEGQIEMNEAQYYTIGLPEDFVAVKGNRNISVTLVYDPSVRKTRADYFGAVMEFHLFRDNREEEIMEKYNDINNEENPRAETVPEELVKYEIKLMPGSNIRKQTIHQKGRKVLTSRSCLGNDNPLVLVVLSQKRWVDEDYIQKFAIVVTLEHSESIDLYNKIEIINRVEIKSKIRV